LRILHVVFNQLGKGTYWRAFHFGRVLAERGHEVTLMAMSPQARFRTRVRETGGLRLVETPDWLPGSLRSGWDLWDTLRRIWWVRQESFDIVHAFEARPVVILPALQAQRRGAKLIMDWADWLGRGGLVEERPSRLTRAALRPVETYFEEHFRTRADGTTVISACLRERALSLGVRPDSILQIRNGSDETVRPLARDAARRATGLPLDEPLVGYAGGAFWRDAEFMAASFNRLRQLAPEARLLLVGRFNRDVEARVHHPAAVIRTGPVAYEQMYAYLAACDLCWLPLRNSGANRGRWPMKLSDYMAAGRPVVSTAVGDMAQMIPEHGFGVVTGEDSNEFASQTAALLSDRERREVMGRAAQQAALKFGWRRLTDELEAFYRRVAVTASRNEVPT
jgi:glycosyltransferase involved in cell wall biosynthesis